MRYSALRAGVNAGLFFALVAVLLGPYAVLLVTMPKKRHLVAQLFFKGCLKLTGLRLRIVGRPAGDAAMYAANHSSYLDIPVLGAVIGGGVFVAKSEVADWPLFGFLARISRTLFISRNSADALHQRTLLGTRMNRGSRLILFPEGTSSDGSHVKRFKTSLFASLDEIEREAWVQPVSVVYARDKHGATLSQAHRETFTWFGDMTLAPHLINVFGTRGCEVEVRFHQPLCADAYADRKQLAKSCEHAVSKHLIDTVGRVEVLTPHTDISANLLLEPTPVIGME